MRQVLLVLLICFGISIGVSAENLIPNPGFELYSRCPKGLGELNRLEEWTSPNGGTPDFFSACYTKNFETVGVPNNYFGIQPPLQGQAYAGIYAGEKETEYLQVRLLKPLEAGETYCLRFFASPPSEKAVQLPSLQVWFRETSLTQKGWEEIDDEGEALSPEYEIAAGIADWTLMSLTFEASGNEQFLILGYFAPRSGRGYTYLDNFGLYKYDSPEGCNSNYFTGEASQDVQNFVPNPGFEINYGCPGAREEMQYCYGWRVMENTPDFFHECGTGTASVPNNGLGYQEPHTGKAYGGFWCYLPKNGDYREFISMELQWPLEKGEVYCLSMWVSLSDLSQAALYDMQMLPSRSIKGIPSSLPSDDPRVVKLTNYDKLLNDREGWTKVSALFLANGGERVLTIGNFRKNHDPKIVIDDKAVEHGKQYGVSAYYYVDDVVLCRKDAGIAACSPDLVTQIVADPDNPLLFAGKLPSPELAVKEAVPPVEWQAGDTLTLEHFLFAFDAAELESEALPLLDTLASYLDRHPELSIEITGHTDDQGSEAYNLKLSRNRAEAVSDYIETQGIVSTRIKANGVGEEEPLAPNEDEESRARNRRVEIRFLQE